ncbi:MAG: glycosyl hydrolase [Prevotella sp.]
MNRTFYRVTALTFGLLMAVQLMAANTKETVEQVLQTITLTNDVDYIVTSDTPFGDEGVVDIQNTEHAVLILTDVKPSKAKRLLASHVQIQGTKAVDGSNCQVKLYNRGTIIMPYDKDLKPLTVYSEQNFEGESCNDFGLESNGGYMNTLTSEKLNNRIRSFKLKRGYMVTFSLKQGGRGYSRCFIAADQDLEMATLPVILDRSISSYRVFKWYDAGKPQLAAAGGDTGACSALNVTSTYSWNQGTNMLPDQECVSHHIYENYPSASTCGNVDYTCHMKTNNEPKNSADDHPQDLKTILDNWENLMATGMRLCSPSSWDGSDYWNGTGFLKEFFDSIDARGWRCDIIDMHCYWAEGSFPNLQNWVNAVKRPVWISEWCWGASWNSNGAFATGVTENQVRDALKRICTTLNGYDYVERYFYWNGERDPSKIYKNGKLTPAGEMYSQLDGGLAYNGKYDYAPKAPKQQDPKDLTIDFNREKGTIDLSWYEYNGEMNEFIRLERRESNSQTWTTAMEITDAETEGYYVYENIEARQGWEFRIHEKDANGKDRYTKTVMAASANMQSGDAIDIDGETWYLGGNVFCNGTFDMGATGWTNGEDNPIDMPWFQVIPAGSSTDGPFLQCYGNGTTKTEEALKNTVALAGPHTNYYFTADVALNTSTSCRLVLSADGESLDSTIIRLTNDAVYWQTLFTTFNSGSYDKAVITLSRLGAKAQFGNIQLFRLFKTQKEAFYDGAETELARTRMAINYLPIQLGLILEQDINNLDEMFQKDDPQARMDYLRLRTNQAIQSYKQWNRLTILADQAHVLLDNYHFNGYDELYAEWENANALLTIKGALPSTDAVTKSHESLSKAIEVFMPMVTLTDAVKSPTFSNGSIGWQTCAGTYKEGIQEAISINPELSYWLALWDIPKEGNEQQTMAIKQEITGLSHGLYAVQCTATTQHFCISDQHAFITNGTDSLASPTLTTDYMDVTVDMEHQWDTLTSLPVYVEEGGSVVIGFQSSKQDAIDAAHHETGNTNSKADHHEGSWEATNFRLLFHPLYHTTTDDTGWGVACVPYAVSVSPGLKFYQIAAITSDYQHLCLEEISETEPGVPFIYKSDQSDVCLMEHGEAVSSANSNGPGNLRGFFITGARVPEGYYLLTEGVWKKQGSTDRPRIANYTAVMRPLNDKQSQPITRVDTWNGPTMPIEGVTEEEIASGIEDINRTSMNGNQIVYDLQGRKWVNGSVKKGVYIQMRNGKAVKRSIR